MYTKENYRLYFAVDNVTPFLVLDNRYKLEYAIIDWGMSINELAEKIQRFYKYGLIENPYLEWRQGDILETDDFIWRQEADQYLKEAGDLLED